MLPTESDQVRDNAYRDFLFSLLTEPMTITELATEWFHVGRNNMALILKAMEGVERCGGKIRVPLVKMPPRYFSARRLLPITDSEDCTDLH